MTHTMNETADIKEQLEAIKRIHDKVVEAVHGQVYAHVMAALTQIMIDLYNQHTEGADMEDFLNKMCAVYMANQMLSTPAGAVKQ